jgi:molybdopterin-guanine dinucleotide biosynthesis protein A
LSFTKYGNTLLGRKRKQHNPLRAASKGGATRGSELLGVHTSGAARVKNPRIGGVVLAGGHSRRMGMAKAALPLGDETMLQRIVRLLDTVVEQIVVVTATEREFALPDGVRHAIDRRPDRGPLEGMAAGMRALAADVDAVYVTSCDVPLFVPAVVPHLVAMLGGSDAVVPHVDDRYQPLSAVYRVGVLDTIDALLADDRLRPVFVFDTVKTNVISRDELATVDPDLASLDNINRPEDYFRAAEVLGVEVPAEIRLLLLRNTDTRPK